MNKTYYFEMRTEDREGTPHHTFDLVEVCKNAVVQYMPSLSLVQVTLPVDAEQEAIFAASNLTEQVYSNRLIELKAAGDAKREAVK